VRSSIINNDIKQKIIVIFLFNNTYILILEYNYNLLHRFTMSHFITKATPSIIRVEMLHTLTENDQKSCQLVIQVSFTSIPSGMDTHTYTKDICMHTQIHRTHNTNTHTVMICTHTLPRTHTHS